MTIRPAIDGRLAMRVREIAETQTDTVSGGSSGRVMLSAAEKARILNTAADVLEEYILAASPTPTTETDNGK